MRLRQNRVGLGSAASAAPWPWAWCCCPRLPLLLGGQRWPSFLQGRARPSQLPTPVLGRSLCLQASPPASPLRPGGVPGIATLPWHARVTSLPLSLSSSPEPTRDVPPPGASPDLSTVGRFTRGVGSGPRLED